ncbi:dehydrin DHN1 [Oryza brachyantha]|uniref:dehydrin DHN1 n=1 Tax=Oryza brachyantha TaxID=4533 RepID=UPI001ADACA97|nr:dehydrin DHN1 [Oryza brachyantha]
MEDERNTQSHQGGEAAEQVELKDRGLFDSLLGKKKEDQPEEKKHEEELVTGMEKVSVEEPKKEEHHAEGEKKESLLSKLHRSSSSSSSSSDEEEEVIDDNGEVVKRKKKKGLKEKIKEKLPGHKDKDGEHAPTPVATGFPAPAPPASVVTAAPSPAPAPVVTHGAGHHDTAVPVEKIEGDHAKTEVPLPPEEEKKGFLDKIKEKLPGGSKKPEDATAAPPAAAPAAPAPAHPPPVTEEVSSPDGKEKKGILVKIMEKLPGYHKGSGEDDKTSAATSGEHKSSA